MLNIVSITEHSVRKYFKTGVRTKEINGQSDDDRIGFLNFIYDKVEIVIYPK